MSYFRVQAARGNEKLEFLIRADSLRSASEEVHKWWYTIISIKEQSEDVGSTKQLFYFDAVIQNAQWQAQKKSGQIQSSDAMQAYKTLVEKYHCTIELIYTDPTSTDDDKILTTARVAEAYRLYQSTQSWAQKLPIEKDKTISTPSGNPRVSGASSDISPLIQKELALYRGLIDTVLFKIENLLSQHTDILSAEKKATLNLLYATIRQTKNITNVAKLKQVGETALKKIGELEVEVIRKKWWVEKQEYIQQTNQLLKQFGSKVTVGNNEQDISKKTEQLFKELIRGVGDFFSLLKSDDTSSKIESWSAGGQNIDYGYYHQLQRLELYKEKLQINKNIFKTLQDIKEKERIQSKIKLIEQNIALINARISGKKVSYVRIAKWGAYYEDVFVHISHETSRALIVSVLFFVILFFVARIWGHADLSVRLDLSLPLVVSIAISAIFLRFVRGKLSFIATIIGSPIVWMVIYVNTSLW